MKTPEELQKEKGFPLPVISDFHISVDSNFQPKGLVLDEKTPIVPLDMIKVVRQSYNDEIKLPVVSVKGKDFLVTNSAFIKLGLLK